MQNRRSKALFGFETAVRASDRLGLASELNACPAVAGSPSAQNAGSGASNAGASLGEGGRYGLTMHPPTHPGSPRASARRERCSSCPTPDPGRDLVASAALPRGRAAIAPRANPGSGRRPAPLPLPGPELAHGTGTTLWAARGARRPQAARSPAAPQPRRLADPQTRAPRPWSDRKVWRGTRPP